MTVRLYIDDDSTDHDFVRALRARGINVTTVLDEGTTGCSDDRQLRYATEKGRVLLTANVDDFYALHTKMLAQGGAHSGIIFVPQQRYSIGEQMRRVLKLIAARTAEQMVDQIEFLSGWGSSFE